MAGFPWSELGLEGLADERTIRRAYATRLKIVRPDVDPAGFQRLVQARDTALRAIELLAQSPLPRPILPADPAPKREGPAPDGPRQPDMPEARKQAPQLSVDLGTSRRAAEADDPDSMRPAEASAPVEIELIAGSRPSPPAPQRPSPGPELVTADVDPPKQPPIVTEPGARPPLAERAGNQALEATGPDAVLKLLSAFADAWSRNLDLPPVAPILKLFAEQSIVARQKLEIEALRAVAMLFDKGLFDASTPLARQQAAKSLIVGLDEDYAWSHSDRRLYTTMQRAAADQMARLLRVVREWDRTGLAPNFAPPRPPKMRERSGGWALGLVGLGCVVVVRIIAATLSAPASAPRIPTSLTIPGGPGFDASAVRNSAYAASAFNQGAAYDREGQFDRAIEEYDRAIRLDPNYALAFYNRGLDYANKGEFDRAIQDYDRTVRLRPGNPDNFISRGVAYDGKGQYDRAIQDYDQAIFLKPGYALAFVDRGIAYANKDQYDRAIQDYDQAIRLDPNNADAFYNRGQAKRAKGDAAGGDADLARAKQLNSSSPPASAGSSSSK